ncbi:MAG: adenine phosphoribosyltransferase [Gammaproteobacteria bacterium]
MDIKSLIRDIPDFPKPGIMYRDITTLLQNSKGLGYVIDHFSEEFSDQNIDYVIGIESRGFIFGAPIAYKLGAGFVPVRKAGKLPGEIHSIKYELEYGTDCLEIHQDALQPKNRILIVDDLIATGGTAAATAKLVKQQGCELIGCAFIIELLALEGRAKLPDASIQSLVTY